LALLLLAPLARSAGAPDSSKIEALERALHEGANRVRGRHHKIPLERLEVLDRVARAHSADMAARGYLAHENPEGVNPLERIQRTGLSGFTMAAENAGTTTRSAPVPAILEGWQLSPVHRTNLLAPAFNTTGVGIAQAADGTFYVTQLYVTFPR
jgi:uncharacterized protein YkwD